MNDRSARWDHRFAPQDIAALSSITDGPVLLAGNPELAVEVSSPDITNMDEPDLVVGATNAADVQAAVRFSLDFRLPLAVMSPGHHAPTSAKGGVLVTTSRMNQIHLDRISRTAIVGAGALWSDVVDRAAELNLAPLVPSYPGTGIVGRAFGWTSGHVRSIDVVTSDGEFRHVTAASDPQMMRRLCDSDISDVGAGIITAIKFVLFR